MMYITKQIKITPQYAISDDKHIFDCNNGDIVTDIYKSQINSYPKFYKMDGLAKLGFVASELLLHDDDNRYTEREDTAVIIFNKSSSLDTDIHYQATIQNEDNYFPSPSLFVYTLPNIVTGEISIRNKFFGETSTLVIDDFDADSIYNIITDAFQDCATRRIVCGWVEYENDKEYEAEMYLIEKKSINKDRLWNADNIMKLKNLI